MQKREMKLRVNEDLRVSQCETLIQRLDLANFDQYEWTQPAEMAMRPISRSSIVDDHQLASYKMVRRETRASVRVKRNRAD